MSASPEPVCRVTEARQLLGHAVGTARDAATDRLADDDDVGLEVPGLGGPAPADGERVGLVDHQEGPVAVRQLAQALEEAGLREDDADVGQGRLGEDRGDVTVGELTLDRRQVVPRRGAGGEVERDGGSDVAGPRLGLAVRPRQREGLVDRAVVAVGEDEDLRLPGREAGQPHRPPVRVGRGEREAPQRHTEAPRQLGADPLGVLRRQHRRDAPELSHPPGDGLDGRPGRVARHGPGVAQREVDVRVAVDVGDPVARRPVEVEREAAGPLVHPGHRHPAEEVGALLEERAAARMPVAVGDLFGGEQLGEAGPVDGGHGGTVSVRKCSAEGRFTTLSVARMPSCLRFSYAGSAR